MNTVVNPRMCEKVKSGRCIDVSKCPRMDDGSFLMQRFIDGADYCWLDKSEWIWSIGQHKLSGRIFAAIDGRYYQNPNFNCLWLR